MLFSSQAFFPLQLSIESDTMFSALAMWLAGKPSLFQIGVKRNLFLWVEKGFRVLILAVDFRSKKRKTRISNTLTLSVICEDA
jgi:hypothetical protein